MFLGVFLIILFLTMAGLAEAGVDTLSHHFEDSIFKNTNKNF
jgi:hypothetical protein